MNLMISEVQITCFILMLLLTMILAFVLPRFVSSGKVYNIARVLLLCGTALASIHFLLQYFIQKSVTDLADLRTSVNLLFGFPVSFCVNLSLIFLQRRGKVKRNIWYVVPGLTAIAFFVFLYCVIAPDLVHRLAHANTVMALLYAVCLFYCSIIEIIGYRRLEYSIKVHGNKSYVPLVKWTKTATIVMTIVSMGFPFVIFSLNPMIRSIYGLVTISSAFVYVFSFIGYGLTGLKRAAGDDSEEVDEGAAAPLNPVKSRQLQVAVDHFIKDEGFTTPGITIRSAADFMGVSVNMLKLWLKTTKYGKFTTWLNVLRVEKAKTMLMEMPGLSNDMIAQQCGFCDRQYFQRLFRAQEGISPTQWAHEHALEEMKQDS